MSLHLLSQFVAFSAILQALILTFILIRARSVLPTANAYLTALVILTSIDIGLETLCSSAYVYELPHFIGIIDPLLFLYGPLIYFYTRSLTLPDGRSTRNDWLHFLPAFIIASLYLFAFYFEPSELKLMSQGVTSVEVSSQALPYTVDIDTRDLIWFVSSIHELIYIVFALVLLMAYRKRLRNIYSTIEKMTLRWLSILLAFVGLMTVSSFVQAIMVRQELIDFSDTVSILGLLSGILIYTIGYVGLYQHGIIWVRNNTEARIGTPAPEDAENPGRLLDENEIRQVRDHLNALMTEQRVYENSDLRLADVARMLNTTTHKLSHILNDHVKKNFYDFVNMYRVEAAKQMIINPAHRELTISALGYEVGFNSKSTFYTAFRKYAGMTPTEYRKRHIQDNQESE